MVAGAGGPPVCLVVLKAFQDYTDEFCGPDFPAVFIYLFKKGKNLNSMEHLRSQFQKNSLILKLFEKTI